ncbi:MAG: HAMP domain-containing histidine kinase [Oscillospiraceae bacterium]|nr:HAMP domain-containing histidine kinase [Oscillospiraceae bacterium]
MRKASITRRWLVNNLGVILIVFLTLLIALSFFVKTYYYSGARQFMTSKINTVSGTLAQHYNDNAVSFGSEIHSMIENWQDRDKLELMVLDRNSNIVMTSSGFEISSDLIAQDYFDALKNGSGYFAGKAPSGEHIMAVTVVTPDSTGEYSALRLVTSLEKINRHIRDYVVTFALIGFGVVLLTAFSGMYFIKSIVIPVRQIGNTAKRYAGGDFSVRITKKKDDELGELCDIINHMAEELAMSEAMKNDFISSVSHELRTPLTAIKGWAETIGSMPEDKETVEKGMRVINAETERLSQMVEELLDFSRMQNGRLSLNKTTMDILAELGDAVLIYTEKAKKDDIEIIYNEPEMLPFIYGDKNRMRQVFINIIDNAIKYTDKGGKVTIQAVQSDDSHVEIAVVDTGCGIAKQDLPKIKTKFYKANHTRRGSGIGLAVADEIIAMHDGKLEIFSEEGKGTTVLITLPIQQKKTAAKPV